jgi:3-hydroxyisobutyrate dehydrogenase-like beta-hydroxyacid dehydrogenase
MSGANRLQVGFVGLGDQGGPMAGAIAEVGFTLHVWARRPQSYDALSGVRFNRHDDLASLAGAVDLLALCLRDDEDIRDLIETQDLLDALKPGATVINHGTGDPGENRRLGALFAERNLAYLDAPVSGGRPGAVARRLTTMVGGERDVFDRSQPVFRSFSRKVAYMGPLGSGQLTKLLNNALTMTNLKNAADVFAVAGELGLDLPLLQDVIAVSSGSSTILQAFGTQIDRETAVHLQALMRKDIEHFADAVRDRGMNPAELRERGMAGADAVVDLASWLERA